MNELRQIITSEIKAAGAIPFARFMDLALYCPVYGYYEKEKDTLGRRGDYYTSVSVGSLFGELLAFQFADWLIKCGVRSAECGITPAAARPRNRKETGTDYENEDDSPLHLVEAGAHGGELARDILTWLGEHRSALFERLQYWIIEPSPRRRLWQEQTLAKLAAKVHWATDLASTLHALAAPQLSEGGPRATRSALNSDTPLLHGIIFCNELLDAFPVHRLGWDAKTQTWFEWGVTLEKGKFAWTRISAEGSRGEGRGESVEGRRSSDASELRGKSTEGSPIGANALVAPKQSEGGSRFFPPQLLEHLPDGYTIEVCPAAEAWWQQAANAIGRGKLVAIDYGLTAEELYTPERSDGTLRAYSKHHASRDALAQPGEQDLTAHVNFSAIRSAGEAAGLRTEALLTQAQFLTRIADGVWKSGVCWPAPRTRQFQTLTHPEHLGHAFRVLVQSRGLAKSAP